ncbi:MAG: hypothetical protein ACP5Q4_10940 [Candidatus Caldatribacteriaceae bacterium]
MFLDQWLTLVEGWSFSLALAGYILGGISIGFFSWRWRRFFFFLSSFLLLFFGVRERVHGDLRLWAAVAFLVAMLCAFWRRTEKLGQFFLGCWVLLNLASLLFRVSREVEIIRFLTRISMETWFIVAIVGGVLSLHRYFLHLVSVLLGSALFVVGYLQIIVRGGFGESFWGEPPLLAFLFLLLAIFMYAFREAQSDEQKR